jgi:hypothetical protein
MADLGSQDLGGGTLGSDDKSIGVSESSVSTDSPSVGLSAGATTLSVVETGLVFSVQSLNLGSVVEVSVDETVNTVKVEDVDVVPGAASLQVSETTSNTVNNSIGVTGGAVDLGVEAVSNIISVSDGVNVLPGNVDVDVAETVLFTDSEETGIKNILNISSPTKAIITNSDRKAFYTSKDRFVVYE